MEILWADTFFEINTDMSLYIYMSYLLEFVAGNQELNINIIQFFMMYVSLPIFQFTLF